VSTTETGAGSDFERWLVDEYAQSGAFTALIVLVRITETEVKLLCSSFVNVIGAEASWGEIVALLNGAGHQWDGAAFFPRRDACSDPLNNVAARLALRELEAHIETDRLALNEGHFFDAWGRRMKVEEIMIH
jgi:predicted exporter